MVKLHYNGSPTSLIIKTFLKPLITLEGCIMQGFLTTALKFRTSQSLLWGLCFYAVQMFSGIAGLYSTRCQ